MKRKKIISFFLIILIILFQFFTVPEKVEAALPLIATPAVLPLVAIALVASGMIFTNSEQARNSALSAWANMSEATRSYFNNLSLSNFMSGIINISSLGWRPSFLFTQTAYTNLLNNGVISFAPDFPVLPMSIRTQTLGSSIVTEGNFNDFMTNAIPFSRITINYVSMPVSQSAFAEYPLQRLQSRTSVGIGVTFAEWTAIRNIPTRISINVMLNASGTGYYFWTYINGVLHRTNFGSTTIPNGTIHDTTINRRSDSDWYEKSSGFLITNDSTVMQGISVFSPTVPNLNVDTETNQKMIGIPPAWADTLTQGLFTNSVAQTREDFIQQGIIQQQTQVIELPVGLMGTLTAIYQGIIAIPTSIARFFDLTIPVNFVPLQVAGTLFTTRFPFSIPWDIARAFEVTANAGQQKPIFNISFTSNLTGNVNMQIDLEDFDHLIHIQRQFLILLFIIGLAMLTPKILKV